MSQCSLRTVFRFIQSWFSLFYVRGSFSASVDADSMYNQSEEMLSPCSSCSRLRFCLRWSRWVVLDWGGVGWNRVGVS
ncbi:hypothetical protein E2C01_044713 [Portunus trituberculatus]|uniref:Secreted protein n=1 Tax=Portunus trituberculatus TaxID=210409 RepID=A0A5B7G092_PORTR|nr:hypothetical protein [Portunus trituberculatus]